MAYTFGFGGSSTNRSSYVYGINHGVKSEYGGFPVGNINDAGWRPVKIYSINVLGLSGGYANIWFGGANSGPGGVWNSSGGMFAIRCISTSSPMYFGRLNDNGVNTIDEADGSVWSPRGGLVGSFTWATVPPAPTFNSATAGSGTGTVNISFSSNGDGGESVDQWQVQYATNSSFSSGTGTFNSSGTSTFTGSPGVTYWFRARGRNDVGWGQWSGSKSATTIGVPSATQNLAATVSTTLPGAVNLSWDAPSTPGGTITGYKIYRNGTLIHTTSGTGETYTNTGLTKGTSYSYVVHARNSYSDSINSQGAASNTATVTAQGVPGPPLNLTAVAHPTIPGRIDLDWDPPTYAGVGGITGYEVYFSTGTLIDGNVAAGTTSYSVTGLSPGVQYGFVIRGKNAVSTTSSTPGDPSSTTYSSALGDPPQVTGFTVSPDARVAGRLKLQWTDPDLGVTAVTGYTIFDASTGAEIARTASQTYMIDGLSPGTTYSYYVKARNTVTDQAGSNGGPQSVTVSNSPSSTSNQPTGSITGAINNNTNTTLNGNKIIASVTATTFSYTQSGQPITLVNSGGTTTNATNTALNGTYTVTVTGTNSLTYSKTTPNLSATATGGLLTNNTNNEFNGTFTLTAADAFDKTVSYALPGPDLAETAVTGIVTNNTAANFNGSGFEILSITSNTFTYAKTGPDIAEISAGGTVTNTTNRDYYNGTYEVLDVPSYNVFRYSRV